MSLRIERRLSAACSLFVVCVMSANVAAQSCEGAETKHVYVSFEGCATAEPGLRFDVYVGNEKITVRKNKAEDVYWIGETLKTFRIGKRTLQIPADSLPRALTTCDAPARAERDGACVAVYSVRCEPLWFVDVALVPKTTPPFLSYERRGTPETVKACNRDDPPKGPGEVDVADTECLYVKIDSPLCQIPLSKRSFRRKGELTLADVPVHAVTVDAVIAEGVASDAVARAALLKKVKEMRFTKKEN